MNYEDVIKHINESLARGEPKNDDTQYDDDSTEVDYRTSKDQRHRNLLTMGINPRTGHRFPDLPTLADWYRDFPDDAGMIYPDDDHEEMQS